MNLIYINYSRTGGVTSKLKENISRNEIVKKFNLKTGDFVEKYEISCFSETELKLENELFKEIPKQCSNKEFYISDINLEDNQISVTTIFEKRDLLDFFSEVIEEQNENKKVIFFNSDNLISIDSFEV